MLCSKQIAHNAPLWDRGETMADATKTPATNPAPGSKAATPAAEIPYVPATWPGAFGVYKHSKKSVMLNLLPLLAIFFASYLASFAIGIIFNIIPRIGYSLGQIVSEVVAIFFTIAIYKTLLSSVKGKTVDPVETVKLSPPYFVKVFLASLLVGLIAVASFIAFIIPFFFIAPRLINVTYYIVDKDFGVMDALKASWNSTDKNVGKVYGIIGAYIAYSLLFITIIGIPFAIYFLVMYSAAPTIFYEYTSERTPNPLGDPAPKAA